MRTKENERKIAAGKLMSPDSCASQKLFSSACLSLLSLVIDRLAPWILVLTSHLFSHSLLAQCSRLKRSVTGFNLWSPFLEANVTDEEFLAFHPRFCFISHFLWIKGWNGKQKRKRKTTTPKKKTTKKKTKEKMKEMWHWQAINLWNQHAICHSKDN